MTFREHLKNNAIIVFLYWLPIRLFLKIASFFPLQNKIVFDNFCGRGLGDDPKYILLQLINDGVKVKYIWLVNDLSEKVPPEVKKVKYGSWQATYHFLTAKIWVDNVKNVVKPPKRRKQFYLQTWHGSFANKKVEKDAEEYLNKEYIKISQEDSSKIDLMYSNNDFKINLFKNSFWYKGPVIRSDSPQLSILINRQEKLKESIFSQFNINLKNKVVIYAPTFRKASSISAYKWDYHHILQILNKKFNADFSFLIRLHPNISNQEQLLWGEDIINVTDYPDMDELMAISDVMITDFSGVAYDMALVQKPVFSFAQDYDDYIKNDRPQYFETSELPFSFARNLLELEENIRNFNEKSYQDNLCAFFNKIGMRDSGKGAQSIAKIILEKLK